MIKCILMNKGNYEFIEALMNKTFFSIFKLIDKVSNIFIFNYIYIDIRNKKRRYRYKYIYRIIRYYENI